MKKFSIFAVAAAAFLLGVPVFAHDHSEGSAGTCPHHQATETAVSQALTLLDQARSQTGDQEKATLEQARQQLAGAQKAMAACEEMCETKIKGGHEGHGEGHADHGVSGHNMTPGYPVPAETPATPGQATLDPVCGMKVDPDTAAPKTVYAGKIYYFCSKEDREKFDKDPEKYLKKQG